MNRSYSKIRHIQEMNKRMDNKLIEECKIYHMPNNYALNPKTPFAKIKFNEAIILPNK